MAFCGYLEQSTATTVMLGPFVDEDDGKTAEVGLAIAQADVRLSKNAGNMAQKNDANAAVHDEIGIYSCQLDGTDTNTLGILMVAVHESGALPVKQEYQIVTSNWWDTMCAADQLDVNVTNIEGADPTDTIRDSVVDDATRIDASELNTLSGHDPGSTLCADSTPLTAAETESEVTDALVAHNLDHLALTATVGADMTAEVADNTILSRILANGNTSAFDPATDGLQLIRDKQTDIETDTAEIGAAGAGLTAVPWNAAWDAEVESEVDDALGGGTGTALTSIPWNAAWDAEVQSEVDDALVAQKLDHLVAVADADDAVDNSIVAKLAASDGDWSGYSAATDALEALRDRGDAAWVTAPNDPTAAAIADAVWNELSAGHTGAGAAGQQLWTDVDAILADTNELQGDWTNTGRLDTIIDSILADTNELQTDDTPAAIAALNNISTAQVNAEVVDALATDTYAEPGQAAPAATASLAAKINYLYKAFRNKITQTAATLSIYNDAGAVVDQKATVSDDGVTFTRGEIGTGP